MTYKKIIIILNIIIFTIVSPIFAKTKSGDYIPKLEFIIQPQNGENFTIDKYKSLEVGKEYQLQIQGLPLRELLVFLLRWIHLQFR